jgi:hypothetical protein
VYAPPEADAIDPNAPQGLGEAVRNGLREIFGIGDPAKRVPDPPPPPPPSQQPAQPPPAH